MIYTCRVQFNHDFPDAQQRFRRLCESVCSTASSSIASAPSIIAEPVLSYGRCGRSRISEVDDLLGGQFAIVYLCDVVSYATVLIAVPDRLSLQLPGRNYEYDSFSHFLGSPTLVGYLFPVLDVDWNRRIADETVVIGRLGHGLRVDYGDEPNDELVSVISSRPTESGSIYVYRIRNVPEYFKAVVYGDEPVYFLRNTSAESLDRYCAAYETWTLTDCLEEENLKFATIHDCFMDDDLAVSYRGDMWDFPDTWLAVIA